MTDQPKSNDTSSSEGVSTNSDYFNNLYRQVMRVQGKLASGKREFSDAQKPDVGDNPTPAP